MSRIYSFRGPEGIGERLERAKQDTGESKNRIILRGVEGELGKIEYASDYGAEERDRVEPTMTAATTTTRPSPEYRCPAPGCPYRSASPMNPCPDHLRLPRPA